MKYLTSKGENAGRSYQRGELVLESEELAEALLHHRGEGEEPEGVARGSRVGQHHLHHLHDHDHDHDHHRHLRVCPVGAVSKTTTEKSILFTSFITSA